MKYVLDKEYTLTEKVHWDGKKWHDNYKVRAKFVGYIRIGDWQNFDDAYPVFTWDCFSHEPKRGFVIMRKGKWFLAAHTIEELMVDFKTRFITFSGTAHAKIKHAGVEFDKDVFIQQAKDAGVRPQVIEESLLSGNFSGDTHKNGGSIKYCPNCKKIRHTSCCACGCGSCDVCGYFWRCYGFTGMPDTKISPIIEPRYNGIVVNSELPFRVMGT